LIGALALPLLTTALMNMLPFTDCAPNPPASDHRHWFRATEVVVQPWRGRHHVYGVFAVPVQYKRHRLYKATLMIQGLVEDLPESSPEAGNLYRKPVDSQHYAMQIHLPSRMALWFLVTGRFGDLKSSCHWWLIIADR
jgi:hypothetical protein